MRWKLLVVSSALASLVSAGVWCALVALLFSSTALIEPPRWAMPLSLLLPLLFALGAAFFVYRHTARRRKTQAAITFVAVLVLSAGIYALAVRLMPAYFKIKRPEPLPTVVHSR